MIGRTKSIRLKKSTRRKKSMRLKKTIRRTKSMRLNKSIRRTKSIRLKRILNHDDGGIMDKISTGPGPGNVLLEYLNKEDIANVRLLSKDDYKEVRVDLKLSRKYSLKYLQNEAFFNEVNSVLDRTKKNLHLDLSSSKDSSLIDFPAFLLPILPKLKTLKLVYNKIGDTIPSDIGIRFPELEILKIAGCGLTTFPNFLYPLEKLKILDLRYNLIGDTIPSDIGIRFPLLEILHIGGCGLRTFPETNIAYPLEKLKELDLCSDNLFDILDDDDSFVEDLINNIGNSIPSDIGAKFPGLEILTLNFCGLSSFPDISILNPLTKLKELYLRVNEIGDSIPSDIGIKFPELEILDLKECSLTTFPNIDIVYPLRRLKKLILSENPSIGYIPSDIGIRFPELEMLDLKECSMTTFPNIAYPLRRLKELNLSRNPIGDTIPYDIGMRFTTLEKLILSQCGLTTFPDVLYPSTLKTLYLWNNARYSVPSHVGTSFPRLVINGPSIN